MARRTTTLAIAFLLAAVQAVAQPADKAQTLQYRLAWNGFSAARATVRVIPDKLGSSPSYTVETTAKTNRFVDLFYRFRGRARVIFLARNQTPVQFYYDRRIRGVRSRTVVDFDLREGRAKSLYVKGGVTKKQLDVPSANLFDPISAIFHARHGPSYIGSHIGYDIFTGESRYRVELNVVGRDTIEVPAGTFDALRITPTVMKVFADRRPPDPRLRQATIWVSNNPDHILLQIRSEIFIGAVTLDLVSHETAS